MDTYKIMFFYMTAMLHINYVTNFSVGQFQIRKFQTTFFNRRPCHMPIWHNRDNNILHYYHWVWRKGGRHFSIFLHQNSQHFCKIPSRDNLMALKIFVFFILFSFRFKRKILSEQFLQEIVTLICYQRCKWLNPFFTFLN